MTQLSHQLPPLPGFTAPRTYAAWPVCSDSTTKPIRFAPLTKKAAVRLWHRARDFDRRTTSVAGTRRDYASWYVWQRRTGSGVLWHYRFRV
jgi:hypothetical protein